MTDDTMKNEENSGMAKFMQIRLDIPTDIMEAADKIFYDFGVTSAAKHEMFRHWRKAQALHGGAAAASEPQTAFCGERS